MTLLEALAAARARGVRVRLHRVPGVVGGGPCEEPAGTAPAETSGRDIAVRVPARLVFPMRDDVAQTTPPDAAWEDMTSVIEGAILEFEAEAFGFERRVGGRDGAELPEEVATALAALVSTEGAGSFPSSQEDLEAAWEVSREVWPDAEERGRLLRLLRRLGPRAGLAGTFEQAVREMLELDVTLEAPEPRGRSIPTPGPSRVGEPSASAGLRFMLGTELQVEEWRRRLVFRRVSVESWLASAESPAFRAKLEDLARRLLPAHIETAGDRWEIRVEEHMGRLGTGRLGASWACGG